MSRLDKDEQYRREGMSRALRIAQEEGVEGLERFLEKRNISKVPVCISQKQLDQVTDQIKTVCCERFQILAMVTLRDEFGFGEKRLLEFMERFQNKAECLGDDFTTWEEQVQILAEEVGIETEFHGDFVKVEVK